MARDRYVDLINAVYEPLQRRQEYVQMDNLEKAFLRGDIDAKTYDEGIDSIIRMQKERSNG